MVRIVLAGGGTGGHIMPLMAIVMQIKKQYLAKFSGSVDFLLITSVDEQFYNVIEQMNIPYKFISAGKFRRYLSFDNLIDLFKIPIGTLQSLWHLYWYMPDVVFSKGGFASFPVVFAAWILRIPIVIHESDAVIGLTNRVLSLFADKVAVSFEHTKANFPKNKVIWTGNPVRMDLFLTDKEKARQAMELKKELPVVLFIGGSQGAKLLNDFVLEVLPVLTKHTQILHICGINNYNEIKSIVSRMNLPELNNYHFYPFLTEKMGDAYAAADLIVSRAGGNVIAEIIALGKASILIPLKNSAGNHQVKNAFYFSKRGAAIIVEESNLQVHMLTEKIIKILENPMERIKIERNAKALAIPYANELLAEEVLKFVK